MGKPSRRTIPMETTMTSGQLGLQLKLFKEKGMTPERWGRILANGAFADLCDPMADLSDRNAWRDVLGLGGLIPETFILEIDYAKLPSAMHMPDDALAWQAPGTHPPIFKVRGKGLVKIEGRLFDFGDDIQKSKVLARIRQTDKKRRWSPGRVEHICAFSDAFPNTKCAFLVIAPGSSTQHNMTRYEPYVMMSVTPHRALTCIDLPNKYSYGRQCRFLAFRPLPEA